MSMISASLIRHAAVIATSRVAIGTKADEEEAIVGLCRLEYANLQ